MSSQQRLVILSSILFNLTKSFWLLLVLTGNSDSKIRVRLWQQNDLVSIQINFFCCQLKIGWKNKTFVVSIKSLLNQSNIFESTSSILLKRKQFAKYNLEKISNYYFLKYFLELYWLGKQNITFLSDFFVIFHFHLKFFEAIYDESVC